MYKKVTARAHTNIALIKYWGKRDPLLFLPMTSSLSLTLDQFYTDTTVTIIKEASSDCFILNNVMQSEKETKKISHFINLFRDIADTTAHVKVESTNHVPTAAGLASSASAFAALGTALNKLFALNMDQQTLSTFVRQGSGSATRSIYGGLVEWQKGANSDGSDSFAVKVDDASWNLAMVTVPVSTKKKTVSSREGMDLTVRTSPFYPTWVEQSAIDLIEMKQAIKEKNFIKMGEITEANGMRMHGTMLGANPPFSYWEPLTVKVLQRIKELRGQGLACYYTMDAGPNVKVLCQLTDAPLIKEKLDEIFPNNQAIISGVGKDAYILAVE